jgi:hypothetical protein
LESAGGAPVRRACWNPDRLLDGGFGFFRETFHQGDLVGQADEIEKNLA